MPSFSTILTGIMLVFALIGAADRATGCRFGPGKAFERGFEAFGPLILVMVGPMALTPLIESQLAPVLSPLCEAVGIDPSLLGGLFLANDSGGWQLAQALAKDEALGKLFGSTVGSTMGCAIMFALPMAFSVAPKEKRPLLAKGITIGLIAMPVSCLVSGLLYGIDIGSLLWNLLPLIVIAAALIAGLRFFEKITIKAVIGLGYLLTALFTLALAAAVTVKTLALETPISGVFDEAVQIIGGIAIFLSGAFPLLHLLQTLGKGFFARLGKRLGISESSIIGLITTTVNAIPVFAMTKDMDDRGIVINMAYMIPASFLLGDHLAFQSAVEPTTVLPLLAGKLVGGVIAFLLALFLTRERSVHLANSL